MSKTVSVFCFVSFVALSFAQRADRANFREDCSYNRCNDDRNLVCSRNNICECKMDPVTYIPWVYIQNLMSCVPLRRDEIPRAEYPGNGGGGYEYGQNPVRPGGGFGPPGGGFGSPGGGFGPQDGGFGSGSSAICTTLSSQCTYSGSCKQEFGNLAECKIHYSDRSLNRCQCCHPTDETGFYNGKCHLIKKTGESCETDEQCILGSSSTRCRRGICTYESGNGDTRKRRKNNASSLRGSSGYLGMITLIMAAFCATRAFN